MAKGRIARDDTAAAAGAAGAGAAALGAAAGAVRPDALPARGPEGGPRRLRALGRVPLRRALVVGGHDRPDGREFRHGVGTGRAASNKGFAEWGELLGDTVIASATLDRLLRHSHVLNIRGESYRLREKSQAGLFASHQALARSEGLNANYAT